MKMSDDFCKKVSDGTKNKYKEGWSPRMGKLHTKETKNKISISHTGKTITEEHKQKLSLLNTGNKNHFYGKHHTEEMKLKRRQQIMERLEKLGIRNNEDKGAKEFFEKYNRENKTNFVSMKFFEIGYYADGYDENLHEWIEYDTPMHNRLKQKKKDLIRQNNIINHFKSINKPLNKFTRVKVDKNGIVKEVIQIL